MNTVVSPTKQVKAVRPRLPLNFVMASSLPVMIYVTKSLNSLRPRQNENYFPGDIFKLIFLTENCCNLNWISLKMFPNGGINNEIAYYVTVMPWRNAGNKPLSELIMAPFTDACMRHSASMSELVVGWLCDCTGLESNREDYFSIHLINSLYRVNKTLCGIHSGMLFMHDRAQISNSQCDNCHVWGLYCALFVIGGLYSCYIWNLLWNVKRLCWK